MEHPSIVGTPFVTERVEARTLDQLALEHGLDCGFVKVDVEGAERDVFDGGRHGYTEEDPPSPVSVYGETKARAESIVWRWRSALISSPRLLVQ